MHYVLEYSIPPCLVLNFDQTPLKYASVANCTLSAKALKRMAITGSLLKQTRTATFGITCANELQSASDATKILWFDFVKRKWKTLQQYGWIIEVTGELATPYTVQKMKFSIKYFFSKCDQISSFLRIWSHLLKKSLMENFIFLCSDILRKNVQNLQLQDN